MRQTTPQTRFQRKHRFGRGKCEIAFSTILRAKHCHKCENVKMCLGMMRKWYTVAL